MRFLLVSGLLFLAVVPIRAQAPPGTLWREGENWNRQRGTIGVDQKNAASGGEVLGLEWGRHTGDFAEYDLVLKQPIPGAAVWIRYSRGFPGNADLNVIVDRQLIPGPLPLPNTGGWGDSPAEFRWARVSVGDRTAGRHLVRLETTHDNDNVDVDGFFLAPADFAPPADPDRFMQLASELQGIPPPPPPSVRTIRVPSARLRQPDISSELERWEAGLGDRKLARILAISASKTSPFLLKAYDTPGGTDYNADFVWHDLHSEKGFGRLPYGDSLGVVNFNTDINFLVGFAPGRKQPDFKLPRRTIFRLMDGMGYRVQISPAVSANVVFLPVDSSTVEAVISIRSRSKRQESVDVFGALAKEDHGRAPFKRYGYGMDVMTGGVRWLGRDAGAGSLFGEWTEFNGPRRAGFLLAGLRVSRKPISDQFSDSPGGPPWQPGQPLQTASTCCRLVIPPLGSQTVTMALGLLRFNPDHEVEGPRSVRLMERATETQAISRLEVHLDRSLAEPPVARLTASLQRYRRFPVIETPDPQWAADFLACLELPIAETYSPWMRIQHPYYNFCRANGQDLYGWWSYGEHAHEDLSTFATRLTSPALAEEHVRGHYQFQSSDGGFPYGVNHESRAAEHSGGEVTVPFLAYESWNIYLYSGDLAFLREAFLANDRSHRWWVTQRDRTGEGLVCWLNFLETARDDPDLPTWVATGDAYYQEALDLNCYLLQEERALSAMAGELARRSPPHDRAAWQQRSQGYQAVVDQRVRLINGYLWDPAAGAYFGINEVIPGEANILDISTFFPLWCAAAPTGRASSLVSILRDPRRFGTTYPVATLALGEPRWGPEWHWHGSNWVQISMLVADGLRDYGYEHEAANLARRNCQMVFGILEKTGHFREFFNTQTGGPFTEGHGILFDYIWDSLPAALMVDTIAGIRPGAQGIHVLPALPDGWDHVGVSDLLIRGHHLTVRVERENGLVGTRASVNGRPAGVEAGRGVFVPWDRMPAAVTIVIRQPASLRERYAPPVALPDVSAALPPHPRPRDAALIREAQEKQAAGRAALGLR